MAMRTLSKKRVMKSVKTKFTFIAKVRIVKLAVNEPIYIIKRAWSLKDFLAFCIENDDTCDGDVAKENLVKLNNIQ